MYKVLTIFLMVWLMEIGLINNSCAKEEKSTKIAEKDATVDTKSQALKPQTTDVLSGKPINKSIYTDYKGKRIYFCCEVSKSQFNMDPERHIKTFQDQGVALEDVPAKK
jgi:YHS domain-containing protein